MSGRKQHFIPQSLLRGFGREGKGSKVQVVAYTHDRGTFVAATDGVGAERNFYSELSVVGEGETLDDKITDYETSLSRVLASLRGLPEDQAADRRSAAEFLTHLVIRNDHFRKSMGPAGSAIIGGIAEVVATGEGAKELTGLNRDAPTAMIQAELGKAWEQFGPIFQLAGVSKADFDAAMFGKMKSEFSGMFAEIVTPMMAAISDMMAKVPDLAADAQRRSLATDLSPSTRVEKLSEYEWRVVGSPHPYVLPDCIAVAYDRDGNAFPLMFAEMETIDSIFAPLSSDRLLVGSRSAKAVPPSDLNDSFAACSWDFFVAESRTESFENLRRKLRTRVSQFLDETIDVALAEALRDHVGSD